jgi:hypothetical protein
MRLSIEKISAGLIAGAVIAGPAVADGRISTNPFDPLHVYVTPPASQLTFTPPSPNGIPYRWIVNLGARQEVAFGGSVGAKSWSEPTNPAATPGWTHTSNWVQLTLTTGAWVTIQVGPDVPNQPLFPNPPSANGLGGGDLLPAISLYSGQDTTSAQDHTFNPKGNGWWSSIQYIDSTSRIDPIKHVLTYKRWMPAGNYTVNIGGAAAVSPYCNSTKPCYTGYQSFQAWISTSAF